MNRQARALSLYSVRLVVKHDAAISTGSPEASRGTGLARSPSHGAHRKASRGARSRDHLHEESVANLARPGPREENSLQEVVRAQASRGSAASMRKLSPNRTSNLSFSLPERREFLPSILRFVCASRGSPRESLSRALTSSRGITPSGLVRAQVQHTSDGVLALGGWDPATQSAKKQRKKGMKPREETGDRNSKRELITVITHGTAGYIVITLHAPGAPQLA